MVAIFADSNRARMRYIKEADITWGEVPGSGITRELRYTSSTLNAQKSTTSSDEIRADRMVSDIVEVSATSTGDVNVEFSAGSHDDFLEGFSYGFWSRPMTFDTLSGLNLSWASTSTLTYSGPDMSDYFADGHRIRTAGFKTPANNDYFQISGAPTYDGTKTTITVTTTTSVIESGNSNSKMYDANDVIILNDTHIRAGTAGASTFDSNSSNSFAAAITAGQLKPGQKIYVDGLGYQSQTLTIADSSTTAISATTVVKVNDGSRSVSFQYGGALLQGNVAVDPGADEQASATNLAAAINNQRVIGELSCTATVASAVVTVKGVSVAMTKTGDSNTALTIASASAAAPGARGIFTIVSAAPDVLEVSPAPPTVVASKVVIKGSMLRNPSDAADITPHSFALETGFEDVGQFFITNGQRVGAFSYDVASSAILKGSFSFQGRQTLNGDASTLGNVSDYTVLGTTSTQVANATVNVGSLLMNNASLSTAVQSISIKGTNNLRNQMAIGNKFPAGIGSGRIEITGTVVAYFADSTLWNKFIDHDTVAINFPLTDIDNNHYEFTFPAVVFSTDTVNPAARDQDIIETMDFSAKRDPSTACTIQIDRFSNIGPMVNI